MAASRAKSSTSERFRARTEPIERTPTIASKTTKLNFLFIFFSFHLFFIFDFSVNIRLLCYLLPGFRTYCTKA